MISDQGESKTLSVDDQACIYRNKRQEGHIKLINPHSTQSSALSPQSLDLKSYNFEKVCTELLRNGHKVKFRAPGNSMHPTIRADETVVVEPVRPSEIQVGNIILYRHENGVIAHRVMRILKHSNSQIPQTERYSSSLAKGDAILKRSEAASRTTPQTKYSLSLAEQDAPQGPWSRSSSEALLFILRGDAAIVYDDPVAADQILGKVVCVERNGRSIDPYSIRIKLTLFTRRLASRLKRFFL